MMEDYQFTEEQMGVIYTALEFVDDKYLIGRAQFVRDELLKELDNERD